MSDIVVSNLAKDFPLADGKRLQVLDAVNFEVKGGTFNSLIGPSGCGKSTILQLIAGLQEYESGEILIGGKLVTRDNEPPPIGFVFQQPRLLNWRTVSGNVMLPLERGVDRAARLDLVNDYLKLVGLGGYQDFYPLQLSGGMQQRVALARALVQEPEILLMDEPFGSLDEITARRMREELVRIWDQTGTTILFVTHNVREAVFLSQQIVIVTPRPARTSNSVTVDKPYPRDYADNGLFDLEKKVTEEFLALESG